jgi:hypothetical protein
MSDEPEKVFDYERQTWVSVGQDENGEQALERDRMASGTESLPEGPTPSAPRESGAARFLLVGGIVSLLIGGLFWLIALALANNATSPDALTSAAGVNAVAGFFVPLGLVLLVALVAIHAFFDISLRRKSER